MQIVVAGLTKYFKSECIFKDLNATFEAGRSYAITGPNGSGKTTLLKLLAGIIPPTEGSILYQKSPEEDIDIDDYYQYYSFVGPYVELIEEFTLEELLNFHFKLKKPIPEYTTHQLIRKSYLEDAADKPIRNFSSGMKLRLKLALSFFADTQVVFLDEPTSNLDEQGVKWYLEGLEKYCRNRLLFVASNQLREYKMCDNQLDLMNYK